MRFLALGAPFPKRGVEQVDCNAYTIIFKF